MISHLPSWRIFVVLSAIFGGDGVLLLRLSVGRLSLRYIYPNKTNNTKIVKTIPTSGGILCMTGDRIKQTAVLPVCSPWGGYWLESLVTW